MASPQPSHATEHDDSRIVGRGDPSLGTDEFGDHRGVIGSYLIENPPRERPGVHDSGRTPKRERAGQRAVCRVVESSAQNLGDQLVPERQRFLLGF